jgi:tricorn protease-like protein
MKSGKLKTKFEGITGTIFDCNFSNDGKYVVAGSWDGMVGLYDAKGKSKWISYTSNNTWAYAVAISPDNKYVFAGDNYGNVFVYDASNGVLKKTVYAATQTINTIKFTKDKKNIVISDDGGVVGFFNYDEFIQ